MKCLLCFNDFPQRQNSGVNEAQIVGTKGVPIADNDLGKSGQLDHTGQNKEEQKKTDGLQLLTETVREPAKESDKTDVCKTANELDDDICEIVLQLEKDDGCKTAEVAKDGNCKIDERMEVDKSSEDILKEETEKEHLKDTGAKEITETDKGLVCDPMKALEDNIGESMQEQLSSITLQSHESGLCKAAEEKEVEFLLRKLLNIPEETYLKLEKLGNPNLGIYCCDACLVSVKQAKSIFDEMELLRTRYGDLQKNFTTAMIQSEKVQDFSVDDDEPLAKEAEIVRSYISKEPSKSSTGIQDMALPIFEDPNSGAIAPKLPAATAIEESDSSKKKRKRNSKKNKTPESTPAEPKTVVPPPPPPGINDHIITIQKDPEIYKCNGCTKMFASKKDIDLHIDCAPKPFKCDKCDKSFIKKVHLKHHIRIHTQQLPFICTICSRGYKEQSILDSHKASTHNIKNVLDRSQQPKKKPPAKNKPPPTPQQSANLPPFTCKTCKKVFPKKALLQSHELTHKKNFKCGLCERNFTNKWIRDNHPCRPPITGPGPGYIAGQYSGNSNAGSQKMLPFRRSPMLQSQNLLPNPRFMDPGGRNHGGNMHQRELILRDPNARLNIFAKNGGTEERRMFSSNNRFSRGNSNYMDSGDDDGNYFPDMNKYEDETQYSVNMSDDFEDEQRYSLDDEYDDSRFAMNQDFEGEHFSGEESRFSRQNRPGFGDRGFSSRESNIYAMGIKSGERSAFARNNGNSFGMAGPRGSNSFLSHNEAGEGNRFSRGNNNSTTGNSFSDSMEDRLFLRRNEMEDSLFARNDYSGEDSEFPRNDLKRSRFSVNDWNREDVVTRTSRPGQGSLAPAAVVPRFGLRGATNLVPRPGYISAASPSVPSTSTMVGDRSAGAPNIMPSLLGINPKPMLEEDSLLPAASTSKQTDASYEDNFYSWGGGYGRGSPPSRGGSFAGGNRYFHNQSPQGATPIRGILKRF